MFAKVTNTFLAILFFSVTSVCCAADDIFLDGTIDQEFNRSVFVGDCSIVSSYYVDMCNMLYVAEVNKVWKGKQYVDHSNGKEELYIISNTCSYGGSEPLGYNLMNGQRYLIYANSSENHITVHEDSFTKNMGDVTADELEALHNKINNS